MPWSFSEKTTFTGFTTAAAKTTILATLQTAYDGSATARNMFHNWIDRDREIIDINFLAGAFRTNLTTHKIYIDPSYISDKSYINETGTPVLHSLLGALVHELGHALTGRRDNHVASDPVKYPVRTLDYRGDNVNFINQIWQELGLDKQISYIAQAGNDIHRVGYQYTNGAVIGSAYSGDRNWNSAQFNVSNDNLNDLLIGGPSANILQSSRGNDFLFGAGGDDELNGGDDRDTAVYFGTPLDYDIRKNPDDSWTVRNVRGAKDAGSDTLKNIEVVQFDGGKTFELAKNGLTFQTDFALVIDTTGSMGDDIDAVKAQASSIIDAIFASGNKDGRIGVVGFKDTTNGEPSQVILPFTDQDDFAARKTAAIAAINGITVDGGGDLPETSFDGLRLALDGSMGQWRFGAGVLRVALFTDAAAKDGALADQVAALARSIGAMITMRSSLVGSGGSVDTFSLAFGGDSSSGTQRGYLDDSDNPIFPFVPSDDPITPDPTTAQVQIFTILTGPDGDVDTSALEDIADTTGGDFLTAPTDEELVDILLRIINLPPTPVNTVTLAVNPNRVTEEGSLNLNYTFTRTGDLTNALSVNFNVAGTASSTSDYFLTGATTFNGGNGTITFQAGSATAVLTIDPKNDPVVEPDETVNITLTSGTSYAIGTPTAVTGIIANDEGGRGNDILLGTAGNDKLDGRFGNDTMIGYAGNDFYTVNSLGDVIVENANEGIDSVGVSISYTLGANLERLILNNLTINGTGNSSSNTIRGGDGNNILDGKEENDILIGDDGNDLLVGGIGNDTLTGDAGADSFVFNSKAERLDRITDFNPTDDTITVSASGFGGGLTANTTLSAARFTLGTAATSSAHRFIYNASNGYLLFDADGKGSGAAIQIATLDNKPLLSNADIFVVV